MILENEMIHGRLPAPPPPRRPPPVPPETDLHKLTPHLTVAADEGRGEWDLMRRDRLSRHDSLTSARARAPRPARMTPKLAWQSRVIAEGVSEEASQWLGERFPGAWAEELVDHADGIYQHNAKVRRRLRRAGPRAQAWLVAFMRHWLYALLASRRPHLSARLPSSYAIGRGLPPREQATLPPSPLREWT